MIRRFSCGSVTPASALKKPPLGLHDVQVGFEVLGELFDDRLLFVLAQQAVVDQDARQLRADRPVQQRGDDRRIDAARKAADDAVVADALAHLADRLLGEIAEPPRAGAAADVREKVGEDRFAVRRVRDFGMELQAVERPARGASRRRMVTIRVRASGTKLIRDRCRPGRRGSSTLRFRAARRRTGRPIPSRMSIVQCARPNSRTGWLCTRPPSAWHMSCMP